MLAELSTEMLAGLLGAKFSSSDEAKAFTILVSSLKSFWVIRQIFIGSFSSVFLLILTRTAVRHIAIILPWA
jgi:hypothetical protein